MLDHQRDDFIIAEVFLSHLQFAINRFAAAKQLARLDPDLSNQIAQLLFVQWLDVVIDLFEVDATLTEQLVKFTTLRSSRFLVNGNHKNMYFVLRPLGFVPFWTFDR